MAPSFLPSFFFVDVVERSNHSVERSNHSVACQEEEERQMPSLYMCLIFFISDNGDDSATTQAVTGDDTKLEQQKTRRTPSCTQRNSFVEALVCKLHVMGDSSPQPYHNTMTMPPRCRETMVTKIVIVATVQTLHYSVDEPTPIARVHISLYPNKANVV